MRENEPAILASDTSARTRRARARCFFCGRIYPALVALLALVGHTLALEAPLGSLILLSAALGLWLCDDALVAITPSVASVFILSRSHTPGVPAMSDYLFTSYRPYLIGASLALFLLSAALCAARCYRLGARVPRRIFFCSVAFFVASAIGGTLSPLWEFESLVYGLFSAAFIVLPLLFYTIGLCRVGACRAESYLSYVSVLLILLLSAEVLVLYLGADSPVRGGSLDKSAILFGWGIWTSMGAAIAVLIPAVFIGVARSRFGEAYLAAATVGLLAVFATHSRGAIIAALAAYLVSAALALPASPRGGVYLAALAVAVSFFLGYASVSVGSVVDLIGALLYDNGRFALWRLGLEYFLGAPLFGVGFFGAEYPLGEGYFTGGDFLPATMHSTPVELLCALGLFGMTSYLAFRASTLRGTLRGLTPSRALALGSAVTMLALSLVENYVFQMWPLLYHSAALAVARLPRAE